MNSIQKHAYFNRIRSRLANKDFKFSYCADDWIRYYTIKFPISFAKGMKVEASVLLDRSTPQINKIQISTGIFGSSYFLNTDDLPADVIDTLESIFEEEWRKREEKQVDERAIKVNRALSSLVEFDQ
jgi:hypothetical protein